MRIQSNHTIWFTGLILLSFAIGCGDPDKNANAGNPSDPLTPPTLTSSTPSDGTVIACPNIPTVSATFSKAMNPATITTTTFTVTGPGGTSVAGAVTYVAATNVATFTPSASFAPSTKFTATIGTGAADAFGNPLAIAFVWTFTTSASCAALPPTVNVVTPPSGGAPVCPNTTTVNVIFSKAINPSTIDSSTFTLTGPNGIVAGTYAVQSNVATFTPSAALAASSPFTAMITTGAADTFGIHLAANFTWTFTTSATCTPPAVPSTITLASACNFGILASSTVTNTGPTTISGGDIGISPGNAVTGFPPGTLTPPAALQIANPTAAQAKLDLTTAYLQARDTPGALSLSGDLSGLTFAPGVYKTASTVQLSAGNVTLDGQGNANSVFVFQIGSTLTTLGSTKVILSGNAQAKNIFWQVGSSATLGTNSTFVGNILVQASITLNTGATLHGRALAQTAAVTLDSNALVVPVPPCQ